MVKLGYTIVYVADVAASLKFYEDAFGLARRFLHESGDYGELDTGATTLAFASHALADANFSGGIVRANESKQPLGMEIAFVTSDVEAAHAKGHDVARVHSGDPSLYGAIAEQMRRLDRLGIPYDVTPGVPAFAAAAMSGAMRLWNLRPLSV